MSARRRPDPPAGPRDVRRARELLGVPAEADGPTLARAYHRLARRLHPDLSTDPEATERFRSLNAAYQVALGALLAPPPPAARTHAEPAPAATPEPSEARHAPAGHAGPRWGTSTGAPTDDGVWVVAGPVRIQAPGSSDARGAFDGAAR